MVMSDYFKKSRAEKIQLTGAISTGLGLAGNVIGLVWTAVKIAFITEGEKIFAQKMDIKAAMGETFKGSWIPSTSSPLANLNICSASVLVFGLILLLFSYLYLKNYDQMDKIKKPLLSESSPPSSSLSPSPTTIAVV